MSYGSGDLRDVAKPTQGNKPTANPKPITRKTQDKVIKKGGK